MFLLFAFDRVHQLVDFLQLHDAHVRVPLRAFQTGVAEHGIRWMKRMSAPFSSINVEYYGGKCDSFLTARGCALALFDFGYAGSVVVSAIGKDGLCVNIAEAAED